MPLASVKAARLYLFKPLAIAKGALAGKCGFGSARLCSFGREKSERGLLLF
jgi:hypothetical protein